MFALSRDSSSDVNNTIAIAPSASGANRHEGGRHEEESHDMASYVVIRREYMQMLQSPCSGTGYGAGREMRCCSFRKETHALTHVKGGRSS